MIKVIKKSELAQRQTSANEVKPERRSADFWVKEALRNIEARKLQETRQFFKRLETI